VRACEIGDGVVSELGLLVKALTGGDHPWDVSLSEVCRSARQLLDVPGVSMMLASSSAASGLAAGSDDRADGLERQGMVLGEGPGIDAVESGGPLSIVNLAAERERWPQLVPFAVEHGVAALFAFPLRAGFLSLGVLTLYSDVCGSLSAAQRALAMRVADAVVEIVLAAQAHGYSPDGLSAPIAALVVRGAVIDQAVGMVSAQLECDLGEAAVRLRAYAYASEQSLDMVAKAVVERRMRFER
jgi:hypothetical protein